MKKAEQLINSSKMGWAILTSRLFRSPRLLTAQVMLNYTCNLHCAYCSAPSSKEVMKLSDLEDLLVNLKKIGTLQISYAGGEPTVYPYYRYAIKRAKELGFFVTVSTNGWDNSLVINASEKETPHLVSVSLDGPKAAHERYRGKGSWSKAIQALEALQKKDIPRAINTVIGKHNCQIETIKWLIDKSQQLGASFNYQLMLPRFSAKGKTNPLAPTIKQVHKLVREIIKIPSSQRKSLVFKDDILKKTLDWDSLVPFYKKTPKETCFAGKYFAFISPSGLLVPCSLLEGHPSYAGNNVFQKGLVSSLKKIQKIPCNDCYLGCNLLRNKILSLDPKTIFNTLKMVIP